MNTLALLLLSGVLSTVPQEVPADAMAATAAARALRPTTPFAGDFTTSPRVLFSAAGDDNAAVVRPLPDTDGDGVPDVAVGWDIFKSGDNLEVYSGAGFASGVRLWGLETQDGISGGYFYGETGIEAFPDITGDGLSEMLTGTAGGGRAATLYDGATGAVLQSFNTYLGADSGWVYGMAAVDDVNGNGTPDFVIGTGSFSDAVFMVDGGTTGVHHTEIWKFPTPDAVYAVDVVGDLDGDGVDDVVAGTGDNAQWVYGLSGASGALRWTANVGQSVWHLAAAPDRNGDGVKEVLVGTWTSGASVRLLDGATGTVIWTSNAVGTYVMRVVPIDDVNGDGFEDVAVASWANDARVLSGRNGALLWLAPTGGDVWAIDRVDDVTGDGICEVAFGSFDGRALLADGTTGTLVWTHSANGHKVLAIRACPDLDGDGMPEVIAGAQQLASGSDTLLWVIAADGGVASAGPELVQSGSTALGGTLLLDLALADPGDTSVWLLGFDPALLPVGGKGTLALAPGSYLLLISLPVPPSGALQLSGTIPNDPLLDGLTLYLQTFALDPAPLKSGSSSNRVGFTLGV